MSDDTTDIMSDGGVVASDGHGLASWMDWLEGWLAAGGMAGDLRGVVSISTTWC